ncbi:uncharacterized protein MONBRDRAFT_30807 [Monosiga brevicollis MX1]|uniref:c-Myc-binding protein n=1 Tax=Monosiga brevicollis TaxID=81824 RepID=A9UPD9_MONBE|nr:uncharacterized protein MONBRDRAFT_30807 [Monosiga brevicollis MX1]EDQ92402.1 predicted protein [Monosiga brevicollis MX1]|eukprot:XP_001742164.1 hypothetical protein [Monosiga brevicollis MX1]
MTTPAIDATKEQFRDYLDKQGIVDQLTKVLVSLYEEAEKPANALEYLQQHLTSEGPVTSDFDVIKQENEELKARNEELTARVEELEAQLAATSSAPAPAEGSEETAPAAEEA